MFSGNVTMFILAHSFEEFLIHDKNGRLLGNTQYRGVMLY
jgi:hypothetical protein